MKKKFQNIVMVITFSVILFSCAKEPSSDVNQDSIYANYELLYEKHTDKTSAMAHFRFGGATGTLLELSSPATVTFGGDAMGYNTLIGGHLKEYSGLQSTGSFVYTDLDNNVFTNTAPTMRSIDFTVDTISASGSYTFTWVGDPLQSGEVVNLWIDGINQNNTELFTTSTTGATSMVLAANKLANLGTGNATVTIARYTTVQASDVTSKGGYITSRYRNVTNVYIAP